ncbi:DUF342 domain-containing protein [Longirhabdus pacifica]|uniref:DUF342 domain-containing protein n=1 Tax=Longirhabdus pacifica TaxID=2305227 RepID=UPI001008DA1A|nr:FapA family protein [Longirhabdus pacifica]
MGKSIDDYLQIEISVDEYNALLTWIIPPDDDWSFTIQELQDWLANKKIVYGISTEALANIVIDPSYYGSKRIKIAQGKKPEQGKNGEIHYLYAHQESIHAPMQLDDGSVDYREVRTLANVKKGQAIARKLPPKMGEPGQTITGKTIQPTKGMEAHFKLGKNVVTNEDNTTLYAAIDGLVTIGEDGVVHILPLLEINGDVDYTIGNIEFVGHVMITGSVLPGFKVKAEGNVHIRGNVEGAIVEAGGSIEINAGILGKKKTTIQSGKDIKTVFIQDANVHAKNNIIVTQSIMHSHVKAENQIICTGVRGFIIGGLIQAGEKVRANQIGNIMSTPTAIEVGVITDVRNDIYIYKEKYEHAVSNLNKLNQALAMLNQQISNGQSVSEKLKMKVKLTNTYAQTKQEVEDCKQKLDVLEGALKGSNKAVIEVVSKIYGNTKLSMGRQKKDIKLEMERVTFFLDEGIIKMRTKA